MGHRVPARSVLGTIAYSAAPDGLWWACGALGVIAAVLSLAARRLPMPMVDVPRG